MANKYDAIDLKREYPCVVLSVSDGAMDVRLTKDGVVVRDLPKDELEYSMGGGCVSEMFSGFWWFIPNFVLKLIFVHGLEQDSGWTYDADRWNAPSPDNLSDYEGFTWEETD